MHALVSVAWLEHHTLTERLQVQFRSGHVPSFWVQSPVWVCSGDNQLVLLSLFLSLKAMKKMS